MIPVGAETAFQGAYVHSVDYPAAETTGGSSRGGDHVVALRRVPVPAPSGE